MNKRFIFVLQLALISLCSSVSQSDTLSEEQLSVSKFTSTPTSSSNMSLDVMSYNIQQMGFPGWFDNHFEKKRLEKLPARILEMKSFPDTLPDVIVFEEVFLPSARDFLLKSLNDTYPYATQIGGQSCSDTEWTYLATNCDEDSLRFKLTHNSGVFILSRWPIEESHSLTYVNYRVSYTFDFMAKKGAVYARINKNGKLFHIVGTHLQADAASHDIRMKQLDELKWWIDDFKIPASQPVILAGDFNINSLDTMQFSDMLSHTNAWVELYKKDTGSVSSSTNKYLSLIYGDEKDKTLDYILYRVDHLQAANNPVLKSVNFKSKTSWVAEKIFGDNIDISDISDHYPVRIHYEF